MMPRLSNSRPQPYLTGLAYKVSRESVMVILNNDCWNEQMMN